MFQAAQLAPMIGGLVPMALNNTTQSLENIPAAVLNLVASRSDNPYPHAMMLGSQFAAKRERESERRRQDAARMSQLISRGIELAQGREWQSGEREKDRQFTYDRDQARDQQRLALALAEQGVAPQGAPADDPMAQLAAAMAPRRAAEMQGANLANQRQGVLLQQAQQAPAQAATDQRLQLAAKLAEMGINTDGPLTPEGMLSRLQREVARRNSLAEQAATDKAGREQQTFTQRLAEAMARQQKLQAEAEYLRSEAKKSDQSSAGGAPSWASPLMDRGVILR